MAKKLLLRQIQEAFHLAKKQPWIERVTGLPRPIRYTVGVILILFGILGILTPIPLGLVFLLIGMTLFLGIHKTRQITFRLIYWLRLHIYYVRFYMWWKNRK